MTADRRLTPFEQGQEFGRRLVAEHPLPPELRERLAELLRPVQKAVTPPSE